MGTNANEGTDKAASEKLGLGKLLAWSLRPGSTGVALMVMGYLTIFCTNTLGVPAATVGTLLLLSKLLDGITDIFAGYIVDKTNTKIGRGRPYELCVIGLWAATVGLFITPASFSLTIFRVGRKPVISIITMANRAGIMNNLKFMFLL